jgi:hypothetical protein
VLRYKYGGERLSTFIKANTNIILYTNSKVELGQYRIDGGSFASTIQEARRESLAYARPVKWSRSKDQRPDCRRPACEIVFDRQQCWHFLLIAHTPWGVILDRRPHQREQRILSCAGAGKHGVELPQLGWELGGRAR